MTQNHICFDDADFEITLSVLMRTSRMMDPMPSMVFAADMPVIEKVIMEQGACYQCLHINA